MRRIFTYAFAAIIAAFLWVLIHTPAAFAADAGWSGNDITYNAKSFSENTANGTTPPSLAKGSKYYLSTEVSDSFSGSGKAYIIYFTTTSVTTATDAKYVVYAIKSGGNYGSKESGPTDITITPKKASASATNAAWDGAQLEFDGQTYSGSGGGPLIADGTTPAGLIKGAQYYQSLGRPDIAGNGTASIIYFPTLSDVLTRTQATHATYAVNGSGISGAQKTSKVISVTPAAASPGSGATAGGTTATSSCDIDGIGWIICPVSNFLAWGMDNIFAMLVGFLEVKPLSTNSSLYTAWSYMRTFANVAFVIAFLIIIYSQLTNIGISNYNVKKLLPRLIIAAILVNLSYLICSIAVDLSNVIGSSLQDVFVQIRNNLTTSNTNNVSSWQSITGFLLAGGTAAAAAAAGLTGLVIASGASMGAAIILLLPILLSLILAVLVALIVLAARQAVIILLIIVSPLAFVAYLLPNTEKWFDKWRSTFMTLLIFFPLFALIFGGSQLAGFLIRDTSDQINIILLGMFVQVAPLVLTPLLIKFSGSLVGRIANLVNDPKKGLVDRTRNWSKERSQYLAAKNMSRQDPVRRRQAFRRFALGADQMKRARDERMKVYQEQNDGRWTNSGEYSDIQQDMQQAQAQKTLGSDRANLRYEASKSIAGAVQDLEVQVRDVKLQLDNAKVATDIAWDQNHTPAIAQERIRGRVLKDQLSTLHSTEDAQYEEFKAGRVGTSPVNAAMMTMIRQATADAEQISINGIRMAAAKRVQLSELGQTLNTNQALRTEAAGIDVLNGKGEIRILADVKSQIEAEKDNLVKNIKIATEIKPGDVTSLTQEFEQAVRQGNAEGTRAYADLLSESANPGIIALRKVIDKTESIMPADVLSDLKAHINASGPINGAAEDIASWSRDAKSRKIRDITSDAKTWEGLTAAGFAGLKKSSQEAALLTGAISPQTAQSILTGPAKQNLKPDMEARIKQLANGGSYTNGINSPY